MCSVDVYSLPTFALHHSSLKMFQFNTEATGKLNSVWLCFYSTNRICLEKVKFFYQVHVLEYSKG